MTNQVGFPVESLGTLVALVLALLGVDYHVLLQAGKERQAELAWRAATHGPGQQRTQPDAERPPDLGTNISAHTGTDLLPSVREV